MNARLQDAPRRLRSALQTLRPPQGAPPRDIDARRRSLHTASGVNTASRPRRRHAVTGSARRARAQFRNASCTPSTGGTPTRRQPPTGISTCHTAKLLLRCKILRAARDSRRGAGGSIFRSPTAFQITNRHSRACASPQRVDILGHPNKEERPTRRRTNHAGDVRRTPDDGGRPPKNRRGPEHGAGRGPTVTAGTTARRRRASARPSRASRAASQHHHARADAQQPQRRASRRRRRAGRATNGGSFWAPRQAASLACSATKTAKPATSNLSCVANVLAGGFAKRR